MINDQITVATVDKAVALSISVLLESQTKGKALEKIGASHKAADDVAAVGGGKSGDSCNFCHGVYFLSIPKPTPKVRRGLTYSYFWFIITVFLGELLCVAGFCGAGLFFLLGALGLISKVKIIFIGLLLNPS